MVAKVISDYFDDRRIIAPFADTDPSLLLNVDFRDGQTAVEAIFAPHGIVLGGSGQIFDETGFDPNRGGGYSATNWVPAGHASRAAAFATEEATIYIEVERSALSCTWLDDALFFIDSGIGPSADCWDGATVTPANHPYGDYTAVTKQGYAFGINNISGASVLNLVYSCPNSAGNPAARVVFGMTDGVVTGQTTTRLIGRVPDLDCFDQDVAKIVYSLDGSVLSVYLDGQLVRLYKMASSFTAQDMFYRISIGSLNLTTHSFIGSIRVFQIANKKSSIPREGPRIAFVGDSYTQLGSINATANGGNVDAATVADIDLEQNGLYESSLEERLDATINAITHTISRPWINELVRTSGNYGLPFQFYNAGCTGRGWGDTPAALSPIPQAYLDAVVAHDPEAIEATGSINDVEGAANPATNLLAETKLKIDSMISRCYNLRKFRFYETWPAFKGHATYAAADYIAEYHRQRAVLAELDGYTVANASGVDVVVEFVPTYEKLGGDDHTASYNIGGSQYVATWDSYYSNSLSMADPHPAQLGNDLMVKIYWDTLNRDFLFPPT